MRPLEGPCGSDPSRQLALGLGELAVGWFLSVPGPIAHPTEAIIKGKQRDAHQHQRDKQAKGDPDCFPHQNVGVCILKTEQ